MDLIKEKYTELSRSEELGFLIEGLKALLKLEVLFGDTILFSQKQTFSSCKFSFRRAGLFGSTVQVFGHKTPGSGSNPDLDRYSA